MNLDRFSRPLTREREPSLSSVKRLQEESKRDLVIDYIYKYLDDTGTFPEREDIQETYDSIYLDDFMVDTQIQLAKQLHK